MPGLADLLLARRPDLAAATAAENAALDPLLEDIVDRSRRANAGIDVEAGAFVAYVADRLPRGRDVRDALAELRVEDLYLACACNDGDPAAVARASSEAFAKARAALARLRGQASLSDDVLQHVREVLFVGAGGPRGRPPRIASYSGKGDLARWIRTVAMRVAMDKLAPSKEIATSEEIVADFRLPTDDPQLELMKREYGERFKAALARAVAKLPSETRAELRAYYLDGRGLEEMAAEQGVAPSTISRRLAKARRSLWEETRRSLLATLGVSDGELDSILRLLQTRLELSRGAFTPQQEQEER
jgi:RNA polymerase sigma-70 factor, ECF subfamily